MAALEKPVLTQRNALFLGAAALLLFLLHALQPILTPFVVGALLAYLGDPMADRLEAWGCGRTLAAALVFAFIGGILLLALLFLLPALAAQLDILVRSLPAAVAWLSDTAYPWLQQTLALPPESTPLRELREALVENWQSVGKLAADVGRYLSGSGINLLASLINLVLVPIVAFYLLRDWDKLMPKLLGLLPVPWQASARRLARECDEVTGAFLRGQFIVMLCLGSIYAFGLYLAGLELAFLIGMLAGLLSIVPYLGTAVGLAAASVAALFQFGDWHALIWVGAVFAAGQMLEGYLLTPLLVGDRIGLHPVAVIFAVLAGGQLAGFTGVLLALPVAAVVMVFLRHLHACYTGSDFYGGTRE